MWSISKNFGSNDAYTIRLELSAASQNVENNQTALHFACRLISNRSSASFTGQARTDTLTVAGITVNPAHGYYVLNGGGSVLLWECDVTVSHDSDGSFNEKSVSCGVLIDTTFASSGYVGTVTAEGTMTLTAIPRASSMSVGELTLGTTGSAAITAASASFRHDIYLTVGGATACLCYDKQGGGSVGITPSLGDFAPQITDAAAKTGTLTLYTFDANRNALGSKSYNVTVRVPSSAAPDVAEGWAKAACYNAGTAAASIDAFVQGYSKAQVTFDSSKITTKYGATIKRYKIACGGVTDTDAPYLTGVLTGTAATITCTVEDSRGYTASGTLSVSLYAYKKPALSDVALYRADEDGTANRAGLCIYARAKLTWSDIGGRNPCSLTGYFRLQSGSYPAAGTAMESGAGILLTNAAAVTSTYVAKIEARDSLGNDAAYEATIPTDNVAFHIRDGGQGAGFGKYAEEDDLLDVAWSGRVRKNLTVDGSVSVGNIANLLNQLMSRPNSRELLTDFNSGYGLTPGLWAVWNESGTAANGPYDGSVGGSCLVVGVYHADGTPQLFHQLYLDANGDVWCKLIFWGSTYGTWKKLTT